MASENGTGLLARHFGGLKDPRIDRAERHELLDIVVITLCAVVCGADNWVEIEEFGKTKQDWFARFLIPPGGIPSHDTFGSVFSLLDPQQPRVSMAEACWTSTALTPPSAPRFPSQTPFCRHVVPHTIHRVSLDSTGARPFKEVFTVPVR